MASSQPCCQIWQAQCCLYRRSSRRHRPAFCAAIIYLMLSSRENCHLRQHAGGIIICSPFRPEQALVGGVALPPVNKNDPSRVYGEMPPSPVRGDEHATPLTAKSGELLLTLRAPCAVSDVQYMHHSKPIFLPGTGSYRNAKYHPCLKPVDPALAILFVTILIQCGHFQRISDGRDHVALVI